MALSKASKAVKVEKLTGELASSTSAIIGTFAGLTASKDFELRKAVRAAGGSYHVVKNKLAARASKGSQIEAALQGLKGVSSVAYTSGDPVALAKALSGWVKDNAEFTFKLGIIDGKVITVAEIGALATMPGKEELFSKLLFLIQSPAQRLATVLNATGRDLAVVLGQGVEKEKFANAAAAAPPVEAADDSTEGAVPVAQAVELPKAVATELREVKAIAPEAPDAEAASPEPYIASDPAASEGHLIAEVHAVESTTPAEPESQLENGTALQAGEAATTDPVEG